MSKSLKFKNNNYLDSSGIMHYRTRLDDLLNAMTNRMSGYGEQAKIIDDPDALGINSGFYRYYGNYGGALSGSWFFIIHIGHHDVNGNYARQIWFDYLFLTCYTRIQVSGNWSGFQQIQLVGS